MEKATEGKKEKKRMAEWGKGEIWKRLYERREERVNEGETVEREMCEMGR